MSHSSAGRVVRTEERGIVASWALLSAPCHKFRESFIICLSPQTIPPSFNTSNFCHSSPIKTMTKH